MPQDPQTAAELAFLRALLTDFYATQIDAGAVQHAEVAAHIRKAANALGDEHRAQGHRITALAADMVNALPGGWAEGDPDWHEPA